MGAALDRVEQRLALEGAGDPFVLQLVLLRIDALRDVDGEDQSSKLASMSAAVGRATGIGPPDETEQETRPPPVTMARNIGDPGRRFSATNRLIAPADGRGGPARRG
jgi:hypothetical protein